MYLPIAMEMKDKDRIFQFINDNSFGVLITPSLEASDLPFLLMRGQSQLGKLYFHMAKANPHQHLIEGEKALAVFQGPHSYISPTWYESINAVPTWNYISIHCYGTVEKLSDSELESAMYDLVRHHESDLLQEPSPMPEQFWKKKLSAISGFSLNIERIQGKEKLGQHRSVGDQKKVFSMLSKSSDPESLKLARYMKQNKIGTGEGGVNE